MSRWLKYYKSIGLEGDVFVNNFSRGQRINLMGSFAVALHERSFFAMTSWGAGREHNPKYRVICGFDLPGE